MSYKIPSEFEADEKIVGGFVSLKQAGLITAGALLGFCSLALPLPPTVKIFSLVIFCSLGIGTAFFSFDGMDFLTFVARVIRYRQKPKEVRLFVFDHETGGEENA